MTTLMPSINHQMTEIYVFIDDYLKAHPTRANWRRSPNDAPEFADAEVLTIALRQGCFGCATLKKTYELVANNYRTAFPHVCSYQQWRQRLHALSTLVEQLLDAARTVNGFDCAFYLVDSKPIPVCKAIRHGRVRSLREAGAYFGKSSGGWFFGFKLHVLRHVSGRVVNPILTPANWDDREAALALALAADGGVVLGDLGYRGPKAAELLAQEADILLLTRADAPEKRALLSSVRQRVETLFSQLWQQFIDRVFSRSWHGLWNTIKLKLLHYNLCHAGILSI